MVKSYLRYEHLRTFGIVASGTANAVWAADPLSRTSAGRAIVPANEEVLTWDVKKGTLLHRWRDPKCSSEVSAISQSSTDTDVFAVGHADGSIRLWDSKTATTIISFDGHRSAVTALRFDHTGTRLASGSKDANIIVWDLIAEVGLYRLRGHKDAVTALEFIRGPETLGGSTDLDEYILSTGKDALIKLWELSTQHCIETHVAHSGECWALGLSPDQHGCITAGNDGELKVWGIDTAVLGTPGKDCILPRGTLMRASKDRATMVVFHPSANFIAAHGTDKNVEIFRIRTEDEVKKVLKRKRKRREEKEKEKASKGLPTTPAPEDPEADDALTAATVTDIFTPHITLRTGGKARSVSWTTRTSKLELLVACTNNTLEFYDIPTKPSPKTDELPDYNRVYTVELPGHRTDIRALALSSDDRMLASAASGGLKVWNVQTGACIRTFECGYALCCSFLPGDKIVVVGTKVGAVELFDVASAAMIETVKAHEGAVWALQVHPDGKSLVTGSADKNVKFWDFKIVQEEIPGTLRTTPRLKLSHTRTLKLTDDILSLRLSPNGALLALSLLDNTVKVFFTSTLKHLLNLYGHKLPVLSIDISSDSKLIATCSADKNVKLWGLDFGDCHKSFFAHNDSVMAVAFEREGHNFFSAGKDRLVRYWDGDKFESVCKMEGHHGEVWALAVGKATGVVVSASHDKSIRVWEQGDDEIFLEEEREKELEALYDTTLTTSLDADADADSAPTKQTTETLMAGERLIEALEICSADLALMRSHSVALATHPNLAPPARNPLFTALGGISAEQHVLNTTSKIRAAHLQDALLVLPFEKVVVFMEFLEIWARRGWNVGLTCRVLFFLLGVHQREIVASRVARGVLERVRGSLREALRREKDVMGFNLAAVRMVGKGVEERGVKGFGEAVEQGGGTKRAFATVA